MLELEAKLLIEKGHDVKILIFDNSNISSFFQKLKQAINAFYSIPAAKTVKHNIEDFNPDLIHVHNFLFVLSPAVFWVAKRNNISVVVTLHNYRLVCSNAVLLRENKVCELCVTKLFPLFGIRYKCYRNSAIETALVTGIVAFHKLIGTWQNKIDKYIVLTNFAADKFITSSLKLKPEQVMVKPNFTNVATNLIINVADRQNYFLFVGRLSKEKGIDVLLEAVSKGGFELLVVGDGPEKNKVEEFAAQYKNIKYVGFQNRKFVMEKMRWCKALIVPSVWYEGFPVTIAESFSVGTPVIASDLGAMSEIIQDKKNGLLFQQSNPMDLIEKVKQLSEKGATNYYEQALKTFNGKYTSEINYKLLMNVYKEVVAKNLKGHS